MKRIVSVCFAFALISAWAFLPASAKTTPAGQTVGHVLFYAAGEDGREILVSQIPVSEMEADLKAGKINPAVRNYSLLDRFVTTVHQEAQGFTVQEFIDYAKAKSPVETLRDLPLSFSGGAKISFWEIDQNGYDDLDTYTYADLYGTPRYNFPLLYEFWDYRNQDYYDPAGNMTRTEVIDHIFQHGEPETVRLAVRSFSQRYMVTTEKYETDYNMENYWQSRALLDNARTLRVMKPMSKDDLYQKRPTASDSRYWTANIRLTLETLPAAPLGAVAQPTASMTEDDENYYIRFACATDGATILYNHNFISPNYTPTSPHNGDMVVVPKSAFPSGTVTMTARAVKEGCTDAGVVTFALTPSGVEEYQPAYSDVADSMWYAGAVRYVMEAGLFDLTGPTAFSPDAPMTRLMLAEALYRLEGSPIVTAESPFSDSSAASVLWAHANGIVNGNGDGTFAPTASITREQIAVMLHRYAAYKKLDGSGTGDLSAFTDSARVSDWAKDAMRWASGAGLIQGLGNGTVAPQGTASRAQVAQILLNWRG